MKYRTSFSGNILRDILFVNGLTLADYKRLDYKELKYRPANLKELASFIAKKDTVVFVCDSDTDGLSAAGVVKSYNPDAIVIPGDRAGERGLTTNIVEEIHSFHNKGGNNLGIVTLDCGISNLEGIERAREYGIDVFVTDHHLPGDKLPNCKYINPHLESGLEFNDLCGSGVIYSCLYHLFGENTDALQYAAIGTIADVVPMLGDNRYIARAGLWSYRKNPAENIKRFIIGSKLQFNNEIDVGWYMAPTINAASRFGQTEIAFGAYVDGNQEMIPGLIALNKKRKEFTKTAIDNASVIVTDHVVFAEIDNMNASISGIVAMKLAGTYNRVTCVIVSDGKNFNCSIRTLDIIDANDFIQSSITVDGGGHAAAAGFHFSIEKKNVVLQELDQYIKTNGKDIQDVTQADIAIDLIDAIESYEDIKKYAPFGAGFRRPSFLSQIKIEPLDVSYTPSGHLRFNVFGTVAYLYNPPDNIPFGNVDIQYEVDYNIFRKEKFLKILRIE